jgi:excisionase family DNA binding protein
MSLTQRGLDQEWLTTAEVAELLRVPIRTIYGWRSQRQNAPLAIRVGKHLRWRRTEVEAWLSNRPRR